MKITKAREISFGWFGPIAASLRFAHKKRVTKIDGKVKVK